MRTKDRPPPSCARCGVLESALPTSESLVALVAAGLVGAAIGEAYIGECRDICAPRMANRTQGQCFCSTVYGGWEPAPTETPTEAP